MEFLTPCPEMVLRPVTDAEADAMLMERSDWARLAVWKPVGGLIPAWPHPMRRVDTDRAAGIAAALGWGEVYAWE